jgi:hypothetical protein
MFRKFFLAVAVVVLVGGVLATPSEAGRVRSGTIIGGWYPFAVVLAPGGPASCDWNVECIAWLESGCNEALVGRDPSLHASIVDVHRLAHSPSRLRLFRVRAEAPRILWGGVAVEFWNRWCSEVKPYPSIPEVSGGQTFFSIPRGAVWMTVSSVDTTTFTWELLR